MGIAPTGAIYKTLTFDGVSSADFGVYITGEAVYNAPERDIEMIDIPGRNGTFAIDKNRFFNIEVTYHCGIFADDQADFATAIRDFRNFLCSKVSYSVLTDEYNPNEYRKAIYKSGLSVTPVQGQNGEFDIVFDCQPQRYLTSGDEKISFAGEADIHNPTMFPARPLLEIEGYGQIEIDNQFITVHNEPIGQVVVLDLTPKNTAGPLTVYFNAEYANAGDTITVDKASYAVRWYPASGKATGYSVTSVTSPLIAEASILSGQFVPGIYFEDVEFQYGTAATVTGDVTYSIVTSQNGTLTADMTLTLAYDGTNELTLTHTANRPAELKSKNPTKVIYEVLLDSTQTALGNPLYLDLDIGEAYKIENDTIVSVNNGIEMPADLPTIPPGTSVIDMDNTISKLDITPHWWRV